MRKLSSVLVSLVLLSSVAMTQSKPKTPPASPASTVVYVVEKGKSYHKKNCKLKTGSKGMALAEAKKKGYKPCKVCKPPQ